MPIRRGHVAPQNTFIDTIIRKFDGQSESSQIISYSFTAVHGTLYNSIYRVPWSVSPVNVSVRSRFINVKQEPLDMPPIKLLSVTSGPVSLPSLNNDRGVLSFAAVQPTLG